MNNLLFIRSGLPLSLRTRINWLGCCASLAAKLNWLEPRKYSQHFRIKSLPTSACLASFLKTNLLMRNFSSSLPTRRMAVTHSCLVGCQAFVFTAHRSTPHFELNIFMNKIQVVNFMVASLSVKCAETTWSPPKLLSTNERSSRERKTNKRRSNEERDRDGGRRKKDSQRVKEENLQHKEGKRSPRLMAK